MINKTIVFIRKKAMLKISRKQQPAKQSLYSQLAPISQAIQVRRTKPVGHYSWSKNELISDILLWIATRPLTYHLTNHPSKTNKTCRAVLMKQERTHKWHFSMDSYSATNLPSHKLSKKDEQDLLGSTGEARTNS